MVSVCATCKGLQKHLHGESAQENGSESLVWVDTTLPKLRSRSTACRACALLLNGVLLHHDRFANINEDNVRITAESFKPKTGKTPQEHLSVELRWKDNDDQDDSHEDDHEPPTGHPDLKLEFFTDGGMRQVSFHVFWLILIMVAVVERSPTDSSLPLQERVD